MEQSPKEKIEKAMMCVDDTHKNTLELLSKIDIDNIEEDDLAELLESGSKKEVYKLTMQLFPLTILKPERYQ